MPKQTSSKTLPFAAGVIVLLIGALVVVFLPSGPAVPDQASSPDASESSAVRILSYNSVNVEDWPEADQAQRILNETQGKDTDQEELVASVIADPTNQDIVYFATYDDGTRDNGDRVVSEKFAGIYRYDTRSHAWERLWRTTYEINGPGQPQPTYHPIGYDDGRLLIREMDNGHLTEGCTRALRETDDVTEDTDARPITGVGPLRSLDIKEPYNAWSVYEPDTAELEGLSESQATCFTADIDQIPR